MAHLESGSATGKFGVYIVDDDGDTENAWFETESERNKVYKTMRGDRYVKKIKKIKRK